MYSDLTSSNPFPVAKLDDIEIYFMHYTSVEEARQKWERRKQRMNRSNMIYKLSQREFCTREDVETFLSLPLEHKVCFAYDNVPGCVLIPELRGFSGDEQPLTEQYFDDLTYLNGL